MSHVPTVLKSDRSVFDKMLPVDDNGVYWHPQLRVKGLLVLETTEVHYRYKNALCVRFQCVRFELRRKRELTYIDAM